MGGNWRARFGQLAIALSLGSVTVLCGESKVSAQIIRDDTLGAESSVVTPDTIKGIESDRISGGAVRGSNLFHSFREFNIGEGRGGYFENPTAIANIFSRVTGSNPSEILGTLGVLGNANLFFLNPNGVLFGPKASLDLKGSFLATTADNILFPDGNQFSGTNPEAPPLLTVNVQQPIRLEFQGREGLISNLGNLDVDPGQNLALVGGDITLDGGSLIAPGGRVELGGLSAAGTISFNDDGSLSFPDGVARSDISLRNGADVDVRAGGGGFITVNARNLELLDGSNLVAGIGEGLGEAGTVAGDLNIFATGEIAARQDSSIQNRINDNGIGDGGNINIETGSLTLTDGSFVSTTLRTNGKGNSGDISINANDRGNAAGVDSEGSPAGIFSSVNQGAEGNAGNIDIQAGAFLLEPGARISTNTNGQGNAGSVIINADTISFDGLNTGVFSTVGTVGVNGKGRGGDINIIATNTFSLSNGASLRNGTFGQGDAGSVIINADIISFDGFLSRVFSTVGINGKGRGGDINIIATNTFSLSNGASLRNSTLGQGDAGSVIINADTISFDGLNTGVFSRVERNGEGRGGDINIIATNTFSLSNGARLENSTFGQGDAGNVFLQTRNSVSLDNAKIISGLSRRAEGKAGSINISSTSSSLSMTDSELVTTTFGKGNAGDVFLQANDFVSITGDGVSIDTGVGPLGKGQGGDINIRADSLNIKDDAQLRSAILKNDDVQSAGQGNAGNININVTGAVTIAGNNRVPSGIFSLASTGGIGNGGNIVIFADSLSIFDGATISSDTNAQGNAGTIQINANSFVSISGASATKGLSSSISTSTDSSSRGGDIIIKTPTFSLLNGATLNAQTRADGNSGNITVDARRVEVINGGQVLANTFSRGNAGKITIEAADIVIVDAIDATLDDRLAKLGTNIEIGEKGFSGFFNIAENGASGFFVRSQGSGSTGDIEITSPKIQLDNQGRLFADSASGNGGNIRLQVGDLLLLRRASAISATAGTEEAGGDGGNIFIDAPFIIAVPQENSDITANAFEGNGGNININTDDIFGISKRDDQTPLSDITASSTFGQPGQVEINTSAIDPTRGLNNLPQEAVEAEVAQGCQTVGGKPTLEFFDIGRGGLPPTPEDLFSSEVVIAEWIPLDLADEKKQAPTSEQTFTGDEIKNMTLLTNIKHLCLLKM